MHWSPWVSCCMDNGICMTVAAGSAAVLDAIEARYHVSS
jgi:hypothetical protein